MALERAPTAARGPGTARDRRRRAARSTQPKPPSNFVARHAWALASSSRSRSRAFSSKSVTLSEPWPQTKARSFLAPRRVPVEERPGLLLERFEAVVGHRWIPLVRRGRRTRPAGSSKLDLRVRIGRSWAPTRHGYGRPVIETPVGSTPPPAPPEPAPPTPSGRTMTRRQAPLIRVRLASGRVWVGRCRQLAHRGDAARGAGFQAVPHGRSHVRSRRVASGGRGLVVRRLRFQTPAIETWAEDAGDGAPRCEHRTEPLSPRCRGPARRPLTSPRPPAPEKQRRPAPVRGQPQPHRHGPRALHVARPGRRSGSALTGPPPVATGQVDSVHVYGNIVTVDLNKGYTEGLAEPDHREPVHLLRPGLRAPAPREPPAEEAPARRWRRRSRTGRGGAAGGPASRPHLLERSRQAKEQAGWPTAAEASGAWRRLASRQRWHGRSAVAPRFRPCRAVFSTNVRRA